MKKNDLTYMENNPDTVTEPVIIRTQLMDYKLRPQQICYQYSLTKFHAYQLSLQNATGLLVTPVALVQFKELF